MKMAESNPYKCGSQKHIIRVLNGLDNLSDALAKARVIYNNDKGLAYGELYIAT